MTQRFETLPAVDTPSIEIIPIDKDVVNLLYRILEQHSEIIKMNLAILQALSSPVPMLFKGSIDDVKEVFKR